MNKKAVSPLIATVLVIGFTVALAAIVMTWGGTFMRRTTEETEVASKTGLKCSTDLNFRIKSVNCGTGIITVENKGNVDIKQLTFRIHKGTNVTSEAPSGAVNVFEIKTFTLSAGALSGATQVDAMATIQGEAGMEDIDCSQAIEEYIV